MPLAFTDFLSISDCTQPSQLAFLSSMADLLSNALGIPVSPSQLSSSCSYSTVNVGSRRKGLRALLQSTPCTSSVVQVVVSWVIPSGTAIGYQGGFNSLVSSTQGALFSSYGNSRLCVQQQFIKSMVVNVQQLLFSNLTGNTSTANGGSPVRRMLVDSGVTGSECRGLASMLDVPSNLRVNLSCTTVTVNGKAYVNRNADTTSTSTNGKSVSAVAGIAVGVVVGVALLALTAFLIVHRKRLHQKQQAVSPISH